MMASPNVLIMMSDEGHDPTETAVPYAAFKEAGFKVQFATEAGKTPQCDKRMMEGVTGKLLGAKAVVVEGCKSMLESDEARHPLSWTAPGFSLDEYNLVLFPGGHDKAVRQIIDSKEVHKLILDYFPKTKKPRNKAVGAICHAVMVLSSANGSNGQSVIHECTTTTLPGFFESSVYWATRPFLSDYYKRYSAGSENAEDSIRSSLADDNKQFKGSNSFDPWPGDAHLFAKALVWDAEQGRIRRVKRALISIISGGFRAPYVPLERCILVQEASPISATLAFDT